MKQLMWCGLSWLVLQGVAQGASFDCAKAQDRIEKMICAEAKLSELDEQMEKLYRDAFTSFSPAEAIKLRQKEWLKRRNRCAEQGSDLYIQNCIEGSYLQRIKEIELLVKADLPCPELPLIKSEQEKAQCFKRWLAGRSMKLYRDHVPSETINFCTAMYQALASASPEVRYIEPVLRTEDPLHPALAVYRQCGELKPDGIGGHPGSPDGIYLGLDEASHGFRIYRVELDGDPRNGLEQYLYEEENARGVSNGNTQYVRVNFQSLNCELTDVAVVRAQEPRGELLTEKINRGLNGMIAFKKNHHILNLDGASLWLLSFDSKRRRFSGPQCLWQLSR